MSARCVRFSFGHIWIVRCLVVFFFYYYLIVHSSSIVQNLQVLRITHCSKCGLVNVIRFCLVFLMIAATTNRKLQIV